jgi:protein-disulfide isomerase
MNKDAKVISIIGVITMVVLLLGIWFLAQTSLPKAADQTLLIRSDSNKITSPQASINIVEFGDYECPACKMAQPIVKKVLEEYSGKVNLVFRHFPLPQHASAVPAAITAEAAGEQGKYFDMHNLLYENQDEWSESDNPNQAFISYARKLNLDIDKFEESIKKANTKKIYADQSDGEKLGINSTPTFYVNGTKLKDFSYQTFKKAIDQ